MTDYSKLSDAQIAEKVARAMGLEGALVKGRHNVDLLHDFMDALELPGPVKDNVPHPYYAEALPFLFFDWPAPLLMAKVKEVIRKYGCETCRNNGLLGFEVAIGWHEGITVSSKSEPRALYEAFLKVMEASNETT